MIALLLSGSPALLSACMAPCLDSPLSASATDGTQAGHHGHGAMTEPAAESPHAHHGMAASTPAAANMANASPLAPPDVRLVAGCDNCCVAGLVAVAAGPRVERADDKALAMAPAFSVAWFHMNAATHAAASPSPPVHRPSPTRAQFALRI